MLTWLTGKKTYIGAAALAITLIAGFWLGTIDATTLAAGLSTVLIIVGFGHKYDRYIAGLVAILQEAKVNGLHIDVHTAQMSVIPKAIQTEELPDTVSPANPTAQTK